MTREEQIAVIRARWPEMSKQEIERFLSPTLLPRLGRGRPKERAKQLATATLFERDGRNQKGMYDFGPSQDRRDNWAREVDG